MTRSITDAPPTKRPSLRERNKQLTHDAILRAAFLLIERDGVARTSMAEVAEVAGVSDTTVFNYFKTKDDLIDTVVDAMTGPRSISGLMDKRPPSESPLRALRNLLKTEPLPPSEDVAARQHVLRLAREDKLLWGAYLRNNYTFARQLAEAFERRAPEWPRQKVLSAAHAVAGALEGVFESLPEDATTESWAAEIDEVLARLERAWRG